MLTPTGVIMDRLAACFWWSDPQSFDQAVMIARHQQVDWPDLERWAQREAAPADRFARFRDQAHNG